MNARFQVSSLACAGWHPPSRPQTSRLVGHGPRSGVASFSNCTSPRRDRTLGEQEWRPFVEDQAFGHFIAPGVGLEYPVVAPTQFVLEGSEVLVHFARPNPILDALRANPRAMLSVAGDWAFIPSEWKAIGGEDPALWIFRRPTTPPCNSRATPKSETIRSTSPNVLRRQLEVFQPAVAIADPLVAQATKLNAIRAVVLFVEEVATKFKYGGNVDRSHREMVISRLRARRAAGDLAVAQHTERRLAGLYQG